VPRREFLVKPSWLLDHLRDKSVLLIDTDPKEAYSRAHIPGARHLDLHEYLVLDTGSRGVAKMSEDLREAFSEAGISGEETVVLYEGGLGIRAPRTAWMLEFLGHPEVRMLDGGFASWLRRGLPITRRPSPIRRARMKVEVRPEILATADGIHANLGSRDQLVLDVRSKGEFTGAEMRQCCMRPGRIPGAIWLEWKDLLKDERCFRATREMESLLRRAGVTREKEVVTYCHRGARAANTFYALKLLGFERVKNYIGSWHEWSLRADLPAERD